MLTLTMEVHTFEVGQRLRCEWRNGELRECEIIERRSVSGVIQYYVHYTDFNRRLDEWVAAERIQALELPVGRSGAEKKRKLDPAVAAQAPTPPMNAHDESAAGELDAATQREHEAATRVKNINTIVLGKWEIQTWYVAHIFDVLLCEVLMHAAHDCRYYSPFPKDYAECDTLYFCEFDLHFVKKREALQRYMQRNELASARRPEIAKTPFWQVP